MSSPSQILINAHCTASHPVFHLNFQYLSHLDLSSSLPTATKRSFYYTVSYIFISPSNFQTNLLYSLPCPISATVLYIISMSSVPVNFQHLLATASPCPGPTTILYILSEFLSSILYTSKSCSYILLLTTVSNSNFLFHHVLHSISSHIHVIKVLLPLSFSPQLLSIPLSLYCTF